MNRREFFTRAAAFAALSAAAPSVFASQPQYDFISGYYPRIDIRVIEPVRIYLDGPLRVGELNVILGEATGEQEFLVQILNGMPRADNPERAQMVIYTGEGNHPVTIDRLNISGHRFTPTGKLGAYLR